MHTCSKNLNNLNLSSNHFIDDKIMNFKINNFNENFYCTLGYSNLYDSILIELEYNGIEAILDTKTLSTHIIGTDESSSYLDFVLTCVLRNYLHENKNALDLIIEGYYKLHNPNTINVNIH